jgi:D-glutamate cyclase-like, C-terminal
VRAAADVRSLVTESVGETIDSLLRVDLRGYRTPQVLYEAARRLTDRPPAVDCAERLVGAIKPGDAVLLCTGFVFPPWRTGEHDGLGGTVILARALEVALGARPVLVVEDELVPAVTRMLRTGGLIPRPSFEAAREAPRTAWVTGFTKDAAAARGEAERLIQRCRPAAGISIERPGMNARGQYHLASGKPCSDLAAKVDYLFLALQERGIPTVAVGDNGNELGMGRLAEAVRRHIPYGHQCGCPCGGGTAAAVGADGTLTAAVSDWGGYALAAMVAFLADKPGALAPSSVLEQLLWVAVDSGIIDGSGYAVPETDGVRLDYNRRLIDTLHDILAYTRLSPEKHATRFQAVLARTGMTPEE